MGTGFLHVLGGALQGVGQGMAAAGEMEWRERRELALQEARGRQAIALEQAEQTNRLEVEGVRAEKAKELETWKGAVKVKTEQGLVPVKTELAQSESDIQEAREARLEALRSNNTTKEALAKIDAEYKAKGQEPPKVTDTVTDGVTGAVSVVFSDGTSRPLDNIIARPKPSSGSGGGGSFVEELRAARGEGGKTPKPAAEPAPKAPSKQPLRARENAGSGAPRMATDAQASAFVNNPANKDKSFVGPDGKRYRVPE